MSANTTPDNNIIEIAGTETGTNVTPDTGMVADPRKDGVPLFLQTQNRDGAKPLLIFEVAKHAIAAATTAEQVKDIRDKALGLAAYAREANDRQLEAEAVEIRARAERRLGEMMQTQKETIGLNEGGRPKTGLSENPVSPPKPTLASQGIDKALAHEARTLLKMPEDKFEEHVAAKVQATKQRTRRARQPKPPAYYAQKRIEGFVNQVEYVCSTVAHVEFEIPEGLTAEAAAKLLPDVRAAIRNASRNLRKLEAALAEVAGGSGEARREYLQ